MSQFAGIIAPHPLAILPHEANKGIIEQYEDLINAYLKLAQKVGEWQPDTIVTISPRGTCYVEGITVNNPISNLYIAKLQEINQEDINFESDKASIHSILKAAKEKALPIIESDQAILNYGEIVPLFYLTKALKKQPELISLTMGLVGLDKHFQLGQIISEQFSKTNKKILFIACADLSHRLTKNSPGGYNKYGKTFDKELREDLNNQNYESITLFNSIDLEEAGEAGIRPICTLLGLLQNTPHKITEHNYSSPEGVGHLLSSTLGNL